MKKILRPAWAEIDLDAIAYNTRNIKKLIGDKDLIAVVKANCYGHGVMRYNSNLAGKWGFSALLLP